MGLSLHDFRRERILTRNFMKPNCRLLNTIEQADTLIEYLTGVCGGSRIEGINAAELNRVDSKHLCELVHCYLDRKDRLKGAKPTERACGRVVCIHRVTIGFHVGNDVGTRGMRRGTSHDLVAQ